MRITITLLLIGISIIAEAQVSRELVFNKNKEVVCKTFNNGASFSKSAVNPNIFKPDSSIYYVDTVGNVRYALMTNVFHGDSVIITHSWYDSDTINYSKRQVYFMDFSLPSLPFEPIFSGGREGYANSYPFTFTSTIGDTLSESYLFDFDTKIWNLKSKTEHHISQDGIDTLALTYDWNTDDWVLNNTTKQNYIDSDIDTLKILMLAPNHTDTINYDVITYVYDEFGQVTLQQDSNYVFLTSIDSTIYDENGLIDFIYHGRNGEGYFYAEEYFYDSKARPDKIYFWNKQNGLTDWTFDGFLKFYYPQEITNIGHIKNYNEYKIYPNPINSKLKIESYTGKLEIYNSMGQLIISEQLEMGGYINTSSLRTGIYLLKLENGYSKLIMKQ